MPTPLDIKAAAFLQIRVGLKEILLKKNKMWLKKNWLKRVTMLPYDHRSSTLKHCYFCWPAVCFSPVFVLDGLLGLSFIFIATAMAMALSVFPL